MEHILASLRELVSALGLQGKAAAIETEAKELFTAYNRAIADEAVPGQRPENISLAICYIAANYILIPERISYDAMTRAAAATTSWRSEPVPGKNGMTKLVKRFARRICPIEHDPMVIGKANLSFTVCTLCHYILRTGGSASKMPDGESFDEKSTYSMRGEVEPDTPRQAGLSDLSTGKNFLFDEPVEEKSTAPNKIPTDDTNKELEGGIGEPAEVAPQVEESVKFIADTGVPVESEEPETGNQDAPFSSITTDVRKKWLASAMVQAKKVVKEHPVLKPAVAGAMVLVKRSIDTYITSEKVLGSLVQKVVKMALLHEGKVQNLPVTTKDLNIPPSDYLKFLAASSTTVAPPSTTNDATLVERALGIISAHARKPVDEDTRQRVTHFQEVTRRKLMGFSPVMASAVIAYIDIARHDPASVLSKVASIAGTNTSSLYNATGRFLDKVGRSGDPALSLNERVAAAFPPRAK